jgi:hypothetical protein
MAPPRISDNPLLLAYRYILRYSEMSVTGYNQRITEDIKYSLRLSEE